VPAFNKYIERSKAAGSPPVPEAPPPRSPKP
jgi:hypothetical protein